MACFEALGFCDAWNVGLGCFRAVAGPAEDLKVIGLVCSAEGEGQNVINVPRLAGFGLSGLSGAIYFQLGNVMRKNRV